MSVSAIFGTRILPSPLLGGGVNGGKEVKLRLVSGGKGGGGVAVIECSSRPQKKSTAHHMKSRPKKTQAWDIRRGPAVYAPLPPLPPEWTIVSTAAEAEVAPAPSSPPPLEVE